MWNIHCQSETVVFMLGWYLPIPIISHSTSIVTLASQVGDGIKWQILVIIDEHLQLTDADTQVRLIEAVGNIPTKWTKLSPLLHQSMEEAEAK